MNAPDDIPEDDDPCYYCEYFVDGECECPKGVSCPIEQEMIGTP